MNACKAHVGFDGNPGIPNEMLLVCEVQGQAAIGFCPVAAPDKCIKWLVLHVDFQKRIGFKNGVNKIIC